MPLYHSGPSRFMTAYEQCISYVDSYFIQSCGHSFHCSGSSVISSSTLASRLTLLGESEISASKAGLIFPCFCCLWTSSKMCRTFQETNKNVVNKQKNNSRSINCVFFLKEFNLRETFYLWFWDETHPEETNMTRFNLGAVYHSRSNVFWRWPIT